MPQAPASTPTSNRKQSSLAERITSLSKGWHWKNDPPRKFSVIRKSGIAVSRESTSVPKDNRSKHTAVALWMEVERKWRFAFLLPVAWRLRLVMFTGQKSE
jgi:hypothetical protein